MQYREQKPSAFSVKAVTNEEASLWLQNCRQVAKNSFGNSKKRRRFCVFNKALQHMLRGAANEEASGNIYFEWFASFPFSSPCYIASKTLACRNILSQFCSQCCLGEQTGRQQNFEMQLLRLQKCCLSTQTMKQSANIQVRVSSLFPECLLVCTLTQHMLKTQNLSIESRKLIRNFPKTCSGGNFALDNS